MKNIKIPSFVTIAILTVITLAFWLFFTVYRVFTKQPSTDVSTQIIEPVDPVLDKEALNKVKTRIYFEEGSIPQIPILTSAPETITSLTVTPTPTATETATPLATESGGVAP